MNTRGIIVKRVVTGFMILMLTGLFAHHLLINRANHPKMKDPCNIFGDGEKYAWRLEMQRRGWVGMSDMFQNYVLATNIINGQGYSLDIYPPYRPTMFKPPLYELILAGFFKLSGDTFFVTLSEDESYANLPKVTYSSGNNIDYVFYFQSIMVILAYWIFFLVALNITNRNYIASFIGTVAVVYLTRDALYMISSLLLVYSLSPIIFISLIYSILKFIKKDKGLFNYGLLGLFHGLAPLFIGTYKHFGLVFSMGLIMFRFFTDKKISKQVLKKVTVYFVLFMIPSAIWMTRNYYKCGAFRLSNRLGSLMYGKAVSLEVDLDYNEAYGKFVNRKWRQIADNENLVLTETQLDDYMMKEAKKKMKHLKYRSFISMIYNFYGFYIRDKKMFIMLVFAIIGIITYLKKAKYIVVPFILLGFYLTALCIVLTSVYFRHNIPLIILNTLLFTVGIDSLMDMFSKKRVA